MKLKRNKTEGLILGTNINKIKTHQGIKWEHGPIESFRIYFGTNLKVTNNLNWEGKIATIDRLMKDWKKEN